MDIYKSYQREKGFNISLTAGTTLGVKFSDEQKGNISKVLKGVRPTDVTPDTASKIKQMINENVPLTEIACHFDIDYETVCSIRKNRSFKYISPQIKECLNRRENLRRKM